MLFKDMSILSSDSLFVQLSLFKFGRRYYDEQTLNFQFWSVVTEEMLFKDLSIWAMVAILLNRAEPFVQFW